MMVGSAFGADHYIREGGSGDGSAWNNAWSELPATLTRGDTYYIADGEYGRYDFDDAESGTDMIYVKKATESAHGTETGWSSAYGDSVALFTIDSTAAHLWRFYTGYYDIDGVVGGGPAAWKTGHGIKLHITGTEDRFFVVDFRGIGAEHTTNLPTDVNLRHIEMEHRGNEFGTGDDIIFTGSDPVSGPAATDILIEYCYLHNVSRIPINVHQPENWIIQYCCIADNASVDPIHAEAIQAYGGKFMTVRWNLFENIEGTAIIALKRGGSPTLDVAGNDWYIYGNIFWSTLDYDGEGLSFAIGTTTNGVADNDNMRIYNNTFVNHHKGTKIGVQNKYGNEALVHNNLWYNCSRASGTGTVDFTYLGETGTIDPNYNNYIDAKVDGSSPIGDNDEDNIVPNADPFANWSAGDFRLIANTTPGIDTGAVIPGNDVDMFGDTRTLWNRGALEELGERWFSPIGDIRGRYTDGYRTLRSRYN